MATIGLLLSSVGTVGSIICLILVWVQMFQRGKTGLGITCIVTTFCCLIGGLITYILGWVNSREWGITNLMLIWTGFIVLNIIGNVLNPIDYRQYMQMQGLPQ